MAKPNENRADTSAEKDTTLTPGPRPQYRQTGVTALRNLVCCTIQVHYNGAEVLYFCARRV